MIKRVTVTNERKESTMLDLLDPDISGFEVRGISGLEPVKYVINTSAVSTMPGVIFNSSQSGGRNVVLELGLLANPTVEEARQRSYKQFPLGRRVDLLVETDKRTARTYGYVESNEPSIFGQDTEQKISILCMDSTLLDASDDGVTTTDFFTISKSFEFPFSNESLVEPLIEFGKIGVDAARTIQYEGDVEVGVIVTLRAIGNVVNPVIYNEETKEAIRINTAKLTTMTGAGIVAGDVIVIDTRKGQKSVTLVRNGVASNIMNAVGRDVNWLTLRLGANKFTYAADSGTSAMQLTIENQILYEGV